MSSVPRHEEDGPDISDHGFHEVESGRLIDRRVQAVGSSIITKRRYDSWVFHLGRLVGWNRYRLLVAFYRRVSNLQDHRQSLSFILHPVFSIAMSSFRSLLSMASVRRETRTCINLYLYLIIRGATWRMTYRLGHWISEIMTLGWEYTCCERIRNVYMALYLLLSICGLKTFSVLNAEAFVKRVPVIRPGNVSF
jgi:hypothetical protein